MGEKRPTKSKLDEIAERTLPIDGVAGWADRIILEAFDAFKPGDFQEIFAHQILLAKAGDRDAVRFVSNFFLNVRKEG